MIGGDCAQYSPLIGRQGDYIAIEDNEVHSNTWWGSAAESAVVIAEATHIDTYEGWVATLNTIKSSKFSPRITLQCQDFPAAEHSLQQP